MKTLLLFLAIFLTACGQSKSDPVSAVSATPVLPVTQQPLASSPFAGRQYQVVKDNFGQIRECHLNAPGTAPAWSCTDTNVSNCNGLTLPTFIKIHSDTQIDVWGSGFEDAIYNNGQFQLTASGFAWQAAWWWSNNQEAWNTNLAQYGVVMTFAGGCHIYFQDAGSI